MTMNISKPMKKIRRNKKHKVPSINCIPSELVGEVLARVAASSFDDIFNAKLSCKVFNEVADDKYVYQHVSLERFPAVPWRINNKVSCFLNRCRESGNPEALYRQGVADYFSNVKLESGVECLKNAANSGHAGALYVLGIILLFYGNEFKQMGIEILSGMKGSKVLRKCRENLKAILKNSWIRNSAVLGQRPTCCQMQEEHKKVLKGFPSIDSDEDDNIGCEACKCDQEVGYICSEFPGCFRN